MTKTNPDQLPDKNIATPLVTMLGYLHPVNDRIAAFFDEHVYPCNFRKGKLLLKAGAHCDHLYFVKKGAIRGFVKEGAKEITTWITVENDLVTSITSYDLTIPAVENIQALEDCDLLCMKFSDLDKLYEELPEFNVIARKLLQHYYRDAEGRAFIVRLTKAEYKYNYFLKMHGDLANRVPLKYIASYIGITLETLSRVRKKISEGNQSLALL